jgi:hypothetical protein
LLLLCLELAAESSALLALAKESVVVTVANAKRATLPLSLSELKRKATPPRK